ncbi:hypothetical protein Tco_0077624 [Tanacetum coccineum]
MHDSDDRFFKGNISSLRSNRSSSNFGKGRKKQDDANDDMYPLPEEGEGLASLMGYLYKCFLRLPKEYNQIRMAEGDEEKTGFHTKEGIYCFTYMPKELKNSAATLQRKMEKVLADERGWKWKYTWKK